MPYAKTLLCIIFFLHITVYEREMNQFKPLILLKMFNKKDAAMNIKINIKVNHHHFTATLDDTPSAQAFKAMLPLTMKMVELNGNEKYFRLLSNLPVDTFHPEVIHEGDLMLWGSNTLVLFYETFSTSYSYTHIGKIDNPTGLAKTLGKGSVEVIFEIP